MSEELDPAVAEVLVGAAMRFPPLTGGNKVLCIKRQLQECMSRLAQEAYTTGFLMGQKEQFHLLGPGQRPAWMDIRLDDPNDLASNHVRFKPAVLKSLVDAGYRRLGDLRWVPNRELMDLYYIGFKSARQVLAVVRRFERGAEATPVGIP
jgi:hypothetical protein